MKKFLAGLFIFLLLVLIALFIIPVFLKNQINEKIKNELNKTFTAKIDYSDFSLDIFRHFPNLNFSLNRLSISGNDSLHLDTLAYVSSLNLTIDLMSVIKGEKYKLLALNFVHPEINAKLDSTGKRNWDIFKHTPLTGGKTVPVSEGSNFSFQISQCKIKDGNIIYSNQRNNTFLQILNFDFSGSGNMSNELYDFDTRTSSSELTYKAGTISYLDKVKAKAQIKFLIKKSGKYTFNENSICLNDFCLQLDGGIISAPGSTIMDISFHSKQNDLHDILSLLPAFYKKNFEKTKTSGTFTFNGNITGIYSDSSFPSFHLNLKIENGMVEKPISPFPLKSITLTCVITKPEGNFDSVNIAIDNFHFENDKSDISMSGKIENTIGWYTNRGKLNGLLNLNSNSFVVEEWMPQTNQAPVVNVPKTRAPGTSTQTVDSTYFKVPANLNLVVNCRFGKLYYEKLILNNVNGFVETGEDAIAFKNFSLNACGGSAKLNARYSSQNKNRPHIAFAYTIDSFDIQQTYKTLPAAKKLSPSSQYIQGRFSSDMKGSGELITRTDLDYNSLEASGQINLISAKISGIPALDEIANTAKINSLQNLEIKNAVSKINIKDGKINTEPTELKFTNGYKINVSGYSTFSRTMDYDMRLDVPSKEFGSVASFTQNLLSSIPGLNLNLPETVIFYLKITGNFDKPDVKISKLSTGNH